MRIADKLTTIAENEQRVYNAGKQAEYDAFWDSFQQNGNRTVYACCFGEGWNKNNWKPKYSMRPTTAYMMFFSNMGGYIDLGEVAEDFLDELGIELDYSNCTNAVYGIGILHAKRFKKLDFSKAMYTDNLFYSHNNEYTNGVKKIDNFVSSEITTYATTTFQHCVSLTELYITGVIAKNNFNVRWSPNLTHDSNVSIINALSDNTSGLSVTLSLVSVNREFETSEGANDGSTSAEWAALIATKSNWTISLV